MLFFFAAIGAGMAVSVLLQVGRGGTLGKMTFGAVFSTRASFLPLFVGGQLLRRAPYRLFWWFSGWPSNFRFPPQAGQFWAGRHTATLLSQLL